MSLASELLSVLDKFRGYVAEHVNSGQVLTIDDHIDRLASVAEGDVAAADAKAKEVLGELYTALHGAPPAADPAPVDTPPAPVDAPAPVVADPAPAAPVDPEPAPAPPVDVAADPQPESATAAAEPEATV